ncbi:MAG: acyl-CoA thioesterase [Acidimicrobiales bacterium]
MDARTFLGLESTQNPLRYRLAVTPGISTGGAFLFGGCALAAAIVAMEEASGRPMVWSTAQYLSYAPTGSTLDIEVTLAAAGHNTTQARAVGRLAGTEILTVNGALGKRSLALTGSWEAQPEVPSPEESDERRLDNRHVGTIMERLETRLALGRQFQDMDGTPGDGRSAIWARIPGHLEPSAATLAILGDFVPSGMGQALGRPAGGNSLDNTLRVVRLVPTTWVLCDIRIQAIENGYGHGLSHLWAEDGTLMATASQSVIVREWRPD